MNFDPPVSALAYQSGFGNEFSSEALPGALPVGQNSPQKVPYGLYAELLSGTAFTVARSESRRTWMYRIKPSANHPAFVKLERQLTGGVLGAVTPNRLRWNPLPIPDEPTDFIDGLVAMVANNSPENPAGISIYNYRANLSMQRVFFNADGELLLVPEQGRLRIATELGCLDLEPLEIAVIPRGLKFRVELLDANARGTDCGFGRSGRYPAENRGLRSTALCLAAVPERLGRVCADCHDPGSDRDFLRRVPGFRSNRHQTSDRFLQRFAHGLRPDRHLLR